MGFLSSKTAGTLLEANSRKCVLYNNSIVEDGAGGWDNQWTEGVEFINYYAKNSSIEALRAEKEGVTSLYSALVDKDFPIKAGNYFKDKESGYTFRVTSDPDESKAPENALLPLKFFTAERSVLP